MKLSKVILLSTVCLFGYTEDVYSASHPAWDVSSRVFMSGIHTYHTHNILASDSLFSPSAHPRGVAESSPRLAPSTESAMLTSYLPSAQSSFFPTLREEYKEASVCFITDTSDCAGGGSFSPNETPGKGENPDFKDPSQLCIEAGYDKHPCPEGSHGDNLCPMDNSYSKGCACDDNMTEVCEPPYYGVGPSCDGKYARCEKDTARACREIGYGQSGSCPALQTPNKRCPYDNSYYDKCVCRSDLVTCVSPQVGVGSSCGGKYESCQCPGSYRECECGGASGASSCTINGVTKYSSCKACCDSNNPNWCDVHRTCHGDCCSDGTIEPCDTRCGGSGCCTPKSNETGCQYGTYACDNGCGGSRLCCKVCDPEDRTCQCPGYVYCGDTKTGSGASCKAGDKTFYETCLVKETCLPGEKGGGFVDVDGMENRANYGTKVRPYCTTQKGVTLYLYTYCDGAIDGIKGPCYGKVYCPSGNGYNKPGSAECICNSNYLDVCNETCNYDEINSNGGSCTAYPGPSRYYVKDKCTMSNGTIVKYYGICDSIDCEGNKGPCYGKTRCTGNTIAVDPCTCGSWTYGSSCVIECPYEQTAADCKAGQTFTQRCKDNNGTWFGECK